MESSTDCSLGASVSAGSTTVSSVVAGVTVDRSRGGAITIGGVSGDTGDSSAGGDSDGSTGGGETRGGDVAGGEEGGAWAAGGGPLGG